MEQTASSIGSQKFFLYARKSTDVEDKQARSIPDQIIELREFAKRENIEILEELIEKQSAKIPGRPVFNSMIERIEKDEACGILAWHPDRLARNSIDGGKIIYLVDTGKIKLLKFPQFWFDPTPQGKFMLTIAFGQSKYYVDSLSENTKRGLRQKALRGEFPSWAPVGYLNVIRDRRKTIMVDKKRAPIVKNALEMFATGDYRIMDIGSFLAKHGITTRKTKKGQGGKPIPSDQITYQILTNPFYYGHFRFKGEVYEGIHSPIITKKLWDMVQKVVKRRSKVITKERIHKPFMGLFRCGECGYMITAEMKKGFTYYRCTKKSKVIKCMQLFTREEDVDKQLSDELLTVSLRQDWADQMLQKLEGEEKDVAQSCQVFVQTKKDEIKLINAKLQRLLDSYLDEVIDRDAYLTKKSELLSLKKTLEEQIINFEQTQNAWLEPMKNWIMEATNVANIARGNNLDEKKVLALKIFGSNSTLRDRKVYCVALNQWSALRADPPTRDSVPRERLELSRPFRTTALKAALSTDSSTWAFGNLFYHRFWGVDISLIWVENSICNLENRTRAGLRDFFDGETQEKEIPCQAEH